MMSPLAVQLACRTTRVKKGNSEPSQKRKKAWMEGTTRWRILGKMMTIPKRLIEMMRITKAWTTETISKNTTARMK